MMILGPFPTAEEIASKTATRLGNVGNVTVISPVMTGGSVAITQGDSYLAADGRALSWRSAAWPSLGGASVTLTATSKYDGHTHLNVRCTASVGSVTCELSSMQTAAIPVGSYRLSIVASYPDGHSVTLVQAEMTVTSRSGGTS